MSDLLTVNTKRIRDLFRMDLHRLLHGKAFYVTIVAAVYLPVMLMMQMGSTTNILAFIQGTGSFESFGTLLVSMPCVLTGILLSISIGQEYGSGFIKSIVTAHANKFDYITAKGMIALVCTVVFTAVYLAAILIVGTLLGMESGIPSVLGLLWSVMEKLILSIPMSLLIISLNLIFRSSYGISITATFFVAMGIIVRLIQMALGFAGLDGLSKLLNYTIAGAASFVTMTPSGWILPVIVVAVCWSVFYLFTGNLLMNKRDIL